MFPKPSLAQYTRFRGGYVKARTGTSFGVGTARIHLNAHIENPKKWTADTLSWYDVEITLTVDGDRDQVKAPTGFREFQTQLWVAHRQRQAHQTSWYQPS